MQSKPSDHDEREEQAPEDQPGELGAEGGSTSDAVDKAPAAPSTDDDSAVGDTDQRSDA
jgi:hypothetical protein